MELLHLKYFEVVAKYEHITRAAEELQISQPSLSKVINRLEQELGVLLFDRQGRNIQLNSFGKAFLKRVERIFLELEDGKRELSDMSGLEQGKISLAWTSLSLLPKVLEGFLKKHPNVSFKQVIASTLEMKNQLENRMIDLCISSPPLEGPGIISQPLFTDEFLLAVPKNHRFAGRKSVDLIEVANEHFISTKQGYGFRDISEAYCRQAGFIPNIVFEGDFGVSTINLVEAGLGISFMSSPFAKQHPSDKFSLLRIDNPLCQRTVSLAYLEGHYLSKAACQFRKYLVDYFKDNNDMGI
jgi:DNA-binding transcriptional LysR family regulator